MITIICSKCYKTFGCKFHYRRVDGQKKLCMACSLDCDHYKKPIDRLNKNAEYEVAGFCFDCLEKGGGL